MVLVRPDRLPGRAHIGRDFGEEAVGRGDVAPVPEAQLRLGGRARQVKAFGALQDAVAAMQVGSAGRVRPGGEAAVGALRRDRPRAAGEPVVPAQFHVIKERVGEEAVVVILEGDVIDPPAVALIAGVADQAEAQVERLRLVGVQRDLLAGEGQVGAGGLERAAGQRRPGGVVGGDLDIEAVAEAELPGVVEDQFRVGRHGRVGDVHQAVKLQDVLRAGAIVRPVRAV